MEATDNELLQRFATGRDEAAFRVLVTRYLDLVLSVARRAAGQEELARDAAQKTFIRLAARASSFPAGVPLVSWLHRTSRSFAIDLLRAEARRRRLEADAAMTMQTANDPGDAGWSQIGPALDGLVQKLGVRDRQVVLLRYYQNQPHAVVGSLLGLSEQAARRRALRALEKLRLLLGRRGIVTSSAALALLLPVHAVTPAVAGLAAAIARSSAVAWAPSASPSVFSPLLAMTATSKTILSVLVISLLLSAVAWESIHAGGSAGGGNASPGLTVAPADEGRAPVPAMRVRRGISEAEQVAKVRQWLAENEVITRDVERQMTTVVNQLSLAGIEELLTDPVVLAWFDDPKLDSGAEKPRFFFCDRLWARYAELAPDAALAAEFPNGKVVAGRSRVAAKSVLTSVSKRDGERASRLWIDNWGNNEPDRMNYEFATIMMKWAAGDPGKVLAGIPNLPVGLGMDAYRGYAASLGPGTDWSAEAQRLVQLFPSSMGEQGLADSLARQWVRVDPDAAFAWITSLHLTDRLANLSVMTYWLTEEPLKAAAWLADREPTGELRSPRAAESDGEVTTPAASRDDFMAFLLNQVTENASASAAVTGLIENQAARDKAAESAAVNSDNRDVLLMWEKSTLLSPEAKERIAAQRKKRDEAGGW